MLNGLGTEKKGQDRPEPSLPRFSFPPEAIDDVEREIREAGTGRARQ
jgi:hypothetical protein